jgi:hypothetical protein
MLDIRHIGSITNFITTDRIIAHHFFTTVHRLVGHRPARRGEYAGRPDGFRFRRSHVADVLGRSWRFQYSTEFINKLNGAQVLARV